MSALPKPEADSVVSELPGPKGPGARLKSAREAKSLNLDKVAAQLHLSNEMLLALEADDYDNLPARVFVVGYLRNYARLVGLPAEAIMQALDQFLPAEQEKTVEAPRLGSSGAGTFNTSHSGLFKKQKRAGFPFFSFLLLFAVTIAVFWGWKQGYFTSVIATGESAPQENKPAGLVPINNDRRTGLTTLPLTNRSSDPVSVDVSMADMTGTADAIAATREDNSPKSPSLSSPALTADLAGGNAEVPVPALPGTPPLDVADSTVTDAVAETAAEPLISAVEAVSASASAPASASPEIILSLTETCWVKVRDSAGDFRLNNNYGAGTEKTFAGTPPYRILIGNVRGARLTIDGEPFDLSGYTKQNVARLVLDPSTL